jgi:Uma2 family endonuclease
MAEQTTLTLDQFLAIPEREDGTHYELSVGELRTLAPCGYRHSAIVTNIATLLKTTIDRKQYIVVSGDAGFILDANEDLTTVRGADVAVNRREPVGETIYPDTSRVYVYRSGQRNPQLIADGESFESIVGRRFAVSEFFQI